MNKPIIILLFLLCSVPASAQTTALEKPSIQINSLLKHDTKKYDRKAHKRYNTKKNKHKIKYKKSKHATYNDKANKNRTKYDKNKYSKYNKKYKTYFGKHTKKHTKKYYSKYRNRPKN